jgi:hypothetical protein
VLRPHTPPRRSPPAAPRPAAPELAAVAAVIVAVSLLTARQTTSVFDFFDQSLALDAGWRVYRGQRLYVDFAFNVGPVYLWLQGLSYRLLGFGTSGVIAHVTCVNALVMVATWWTARRALPLATSLLATGLAGIAFYGIIAFPWYDQTASALLVLAAALVDGALPLERRGSALAVGFTCGVAGAACVLSKINIGAAGCAILAATLATQPRRVYSLAAFAAGAACGAALLLACLPDAGEYLTQLTRDYAPPSRLLFWPRLAETLTTTPFPPMLALTAVFWWLRRPAEGAERRAHDGRAALAAGLLATSTASAYTSGMRLAANMPMLGMQVALLLALARPIRKPALLNVAVVLLIAVAGQRMRDHAVWAWNPASLETDHAFRSGPLAGWRCAKRIGEPLEEAVRFLIEHVPARDSLFVYPDCTIAYALAGRESYRGVPAYFYVSPAESSPPRGRLLDATRARLASAPPDWILIHRQTEVELTRTETLLSFLGLDAILARDYALERSWPGFELYRRLDKARAGSLQSGT